MCRLYHQLVLKWNNITHGPTDGIKAMIMSLSHKSVIRRERGIVRGTTICVCLLLRHECVFFITNWFWGKMVQFTVWQITYINYLNLLFGGSLLWSLIVSSHLSKWDLNHQNFCKSTDIYIIFHENIKNLNLPPLLLL